MARSGVARRGAARRGVAWRGVLWCGVIDLERRDLLHDTGRQASAGARVRRLECIGFGRGEPLLVYFGRAAQH